MDDLRKLPIRELAQTIASKHTTVKALTTAYLDRIEAINPALNAVIHFDPEMALKHAERADLALAGGETPGKLFGIPMTIKDSLDTFDMITTWGTQGRANFRPGSDATCVARLRDAGAILMGKTNTPEFTLAFKTDNDLFGRTNNPFDTERTPGGSSGGAAAIVAGGGSAFDVGTDTGGSIRLPSHFCGNAAIKPTTGRVPCTGNSLPSTGWIAPLTQPGPIANCVDDLVYLLEIMQGPDNIDPHAIPAPWLDPYNVDVSALRIGYHADNGIKTPDQPIVDAISRVCSLLNDANIVTSEARPTGVEMSGFLYSRLLAADDGEMISGLLEDAQTSAPSSIITNILQGQSGEHSIKQSAEDFARVITLWHNYQSSMLGFFDDFDILISPVNAHTAPTHDQNVDFGAYTYTAAYNLTGWPGVVIRAGTDPNGLPVGIQVLARPFREDHALALASWLEAKLQEQSGTFPGPEI
jgi:amidase